MKSSRLNPARLPLALLALVVLALGAMTAASTAQAEPKSLVWKVNGKILGANETREATGKNIGNTTFESSKIVVTCEEGRAARGSFIANEGGATGQAISEGTAEASKCSVKGNGEGCKVVEPVRSKEARSVVALNDTEPGIGNDLLALSDPRKGSEWAELKFEGATCKFLNTQVTGLSVGSSWTDPAVSGEEKQIELGALPEATSFLGKNPVEPKSIWRWSPASGKWELFEPTGLKAFNEKAKTTGTALGSLVSGEKFGLTES